MATQRPTVLTSATRLAPLDGREHSRSPSRSPTRKAEFTAHELDPLLSNLSPKSTLDALSSIEAVQPEGRNEHHELAKSIAQASTAERALGIRAAVAAQKLREWYAEVSVWSWPDSQKASQGKGFEPPKDVIQDGFFGSLPVDTLRSYEDRVEEIKDGMEALNVEELKEHVLSAHMSSRSRSSSYSGQEPPSPLAMNYTQLKDFTAVITATILQALPFLSKLNMLLGTWDARLLVLRQIPSLLRGLNDTRDAIETAWSAVTSEDGIPTLSNNEYQSCRRLLEGKVSSLGSKMDQILDALEGREDVLPEAWIDEMEAIEADFGNWVVEAERVLLQQELSARDRALGETSESPQMPNDLAAVTPDEQTNNKGAATTSAANTTPMDAHDIASELQSHKHEMLNGRELTPMLPKEHKSEIPSSPPLATSMKAVQTPALEQQAVPKLPEILRLPSIKPDDTVTAFGPKTVDKSFADPSKSQEPHMQDKTRSYKRDSVLSNPREDGLVAALGSSNKGLIAKPEIVEPNVHEARRSEDSDVTTTQSSRDAIRPQVNSVASSKSLGGVLRVDTEGFQNPRHSSQSGNVEEAGLGSGGRNHRPPALDLSNHQHKRKTSNVSALSSAGASDYLSDISTPEILDASTAEVYGTPVVVDSPYRAQDKDYFSTSKQKQKPRTQSMYLSNNKTPSNVPKGGAHTRAISVPLASLPADEPTTPKEPNAEDIPGTEGDEEDNANGAEPAPILKRASMTSIGSLPKDKLKTIVVSRTGSYSSLASARSKQKSPDHVSDALKTLAGAESNSRKGTPANDEERSPSPITRSPERRLLKKEIHDEEPSPLLRLVTRPKVPLHDPESPISPPIPRRSSKRLSQGSSFTTSPVTPTGRDKESSPHTPASIETLTKPSPLKIAESRSPTTPTTLSKTNEETIEEKIHDLLTTIPARIHLASSSAFPSDVQFSKPSQRAKERKREEDRDNDGLSSRSASNTPSTRSPTPTPSITLTPLKPSATGPLARMSNDPSIAVYHLSRGGQGGKDAAPVKLFVRLVGQNPERVMVRVGGGWADLGEYLREYALHHGQRALSNGRIEVQGLPNQNPSPVPPVSTSRAPSNHLAPGKARAPTASRPTSALDDLQSILDAGPPDSLDVRKTRRGSAIKPIEGNLPPSPIGMAVTTPDFNKPTRIPTLPTHSPPPVPSDAAFRHRTSSLSSSGFTPSHPSHTDTNTSFTSTTTTTTTSTSGSSLTPSHSTTGGGGGYVPLGASGPKHRSVSAMKPESEAWVEGMVGQARRASGRVPASGRVTPGYDNPTTGAAPAPTTTPSPPTNKAKLTPMELRRELESKRARKSSPGGQKTGGGGIRRVFLKGKEKLRDV